MTEENHEFFLPGTDMGPVPSGFIQNFAWGTLSIAAGNSLSLYDGNTISGAAQYAKVIKGVVITEDTAANITGNGHNFYYAADFPGNAYLNSRTYDLINGGRQIPVSPYCSDSDLDLDGRDLQRFICFFVSRHAKANIQKGWPG